MRKGGEAAGALLHRLSAVIDPFLGEVVLRQLFLGENLERFAYLTVDRIDNGGGKPRMLGLDPGVQGEQAGFQHHTRTCITRSASSTGINRPD